jgi:anaerobic selenocysteine-containing dehydrogenase
MRQHPSGIAFEGREMAAGNVIPNLIAHADKRIAVGHPDTLAELREVLREPIIDSGAYAPGDDFRFRMITYRMKEVYCTQGQNLPSLRRKRKYNPVLMNPEAMRELELEEGDGVVVENANGRVEGIVEASRDLKGHTIAFAFGWGNPRDPRPVSEQGSNVQALTSDDSNYDSVTGLALQSAIPVNVRRATDAVTPNSEERI